MFGGHSVWIAVFLVCTWLDSSSSLKCCVCSNTEDCKVNEKVTCTRKQVDELFTHGKKYLQGVIRYQLPHRLRYMCVYDTVVLNDGRRMEFKGCMYEDISYCDLKLQDKMEEDAGERICRFEKRNMCSKAARVIANASAWIIYLSMWIVLHLGGLSSRPLSRFRP